MSARIPVRFIACLLSVHSASAFAADYFLTIGGGYSPSGNQVSLEKNVLLFQRTLVDCTVNDRPHDIYFADGFDSANDVQVVDRESVPKANRLMAEFFGSHDKLGLTYRNHQVPNVRGSASPVNIRQWFQEARGRLTSGDRLIIYVTAHGNRSEDRGNAYDTTIATWNNTSIRMQEFARMLDQLPQGVNVVTIMVQCYSGGFSRLIFEDGDPDKGLANQSRCGFFATVHGRPAAGCTPEVDEASYVEYSTYFWTALSGRDRSGNTIVRPDYDEDGKVSFAEAHAYTLLTADTIDAPVTTSSAFLDVYSYFGRRGESLLQEEEPYGVIHGLASPVQRAVLDGLSEQLGLSGSKRIVDAYQQSQQRRGRGRPRVRRDPAAQLRNRIANDIERRWPGLANTLNPISIDLVTSRKNEFISAVESHSEYARYRELVDADDSATSDEKRRVKCERLVRIADNVMLAENLKRIGDAEAVRTYKAIVRAEAGSLGR